MLNYSLLKSVSLRDTKQRVISMSQLKMYYFPKGQVEELTLPEGYSVSYYKDESDVMPWIECCKNGLVSDDAGQDEFNGRIYDHKDTSTDDIIFIDYNGEHVGTITAIYHPEEKIGEVHMVGVRTDFRGKGLGKYLNNLALIKLADKNVRFIYLTTDDWRKAAVKSYLSSGFQPVQYDLGMQERWEKVLEEFNIDSVDMVYEDGTFYKKIYKSSIAPKVKIGVLGAGRGRGMMDYCVTAGNAELVAICDNWEYNLNIARERYGDKVAYYTDYDEFLKHDMDGVVLANYANAHVPFAVKALKAGKAVLSEVLPVQTMAEAVELVEAVEETGALYAYAENYCYMPAPKEMKRLYDDGVLGKFEYGEGEYMHNCEPIWHEITRGEPEHWRNNMSAFYYCTHSLGPVLHMCGLRPVKVTGFEIPFNDRMARMGAKAGPIGVEMVTLENGAVIKSVHGVGVSKNSVWYSVYGSKGRMESFREDGSDDGVSHLYVNCDKYEGQNDSEPYEADTSDDLTEMSAGNGHSGSDFYTMYHFVDAVRGNKNADIIDVYEALDMGLPGIFALKSAAAGGAPMDLPNLKNKEERDFWRNNTECTDPDVAGDMLIPSYSKGNPEIPAETYKFWSDKFDEWSKNKK